MLEQLNSYDWEEAFGEGSGGNTNLETEAFGGVSDQQFVREDVAEILAMQDGENEEADWVGLFRLRDGRCAAVTGGCDYTGWD